MLAYNEVTAKKYIIKDGEPFEVLSSHVFRKQQRKPVNQTKLKNLLTGKVVEHSFHQSDKVDEAEIEKKEVAYVYHNKGQWWFSALNDPSARFNLSDDFIGDAGKFFKEKMTIEILQWGERVIGVKPPIKVTLRVTMAPPGIKGDTAQGGSKRVTLETGAEVMTPLFVNEGDAIEVNTETGEYSGRGES